MSNNMNIPEKGVIIPHNAELVFDGIRAKIYQWDQKMYDGSIARFERIKFMSGAFVIPVLENGNILLTHQEQPARPAFISLPGGGIEEGEDFLSGAQRELREETGAVSDDWQPFMKFYGTVHTLTEVQYFVARNCRICEPVTPDAGERISLFEVDFDEFLALASNVQFHHHWNLLPILYEARLSREKYQELYEAIYGEGPEV